MDATLKRFSTKKNHLEASTILAYVRDYRRDRERAAMWQRMSEEARAAMREALERVSGRHIIRETLERMRADKSG